MGGYIVAFAGYSGAGKNSIINGLREKYPLFTYIPSVTTRKMRQGEKNGNPYYFVTKEDFMRKIQQGYFIEYEEIHGNFYGTPKKPYWEAIQNGQIVLVDIGIEGALSFKKIFGQAAILLFIEPPSLEELKKRLVQRGESINEIRHRFQRIEYEKSKKFLFDETIINDDLSKAIQQCEKILSQRISNLNAYQ
jgi:guanylate kinase